MNHELKYKFITLLGKNIHLQELLSQEFLDLTLQAWSTKRTDKWTLMKLKDPVQRMK